MGLLRDAWRAGYRPKISPMPADTPTPSNAAEIGNANSHAIANTCDNMIEVINESAAPSAMPITPPIDVSTIASKINCRRISLSVAPTALRSPISRVRSVTETSIIFMMPMPPTTSEIAATAPKNSVSTLVITPSRSTISTCVSIKKSSFISPEIRCESRKVILMSSTI